MPDCMTLFYGAHPRHSGDSCGLCRFWCMAFKGTCSRLTSICRALANTGSGSSKVGAAIALFYGGLTRLAAIAIGVAWLTGIGVFGLEPMLENSHYIGFAAFFFLTGTQVVFDRSPAVSPVSIRQSRLCAWRWRALRIGVGISLVTVAFTEKLAVNPPKAQPFAATSAEFHRSVGHADVRCHVVRRAGMVQRLVCLFVLLALFPRSNDSRCLVTVQSDADGLRLGGADMLSAVLQLDGAPAGLAHWRSRTCGSRDWAIGEYAGADSRASVEHVVSASQPFTDAMTARTITPPRTGRRP